MGNSNSLIRIENNSPALKTPGIPPKKEVAIKDKPETIVTPSPTSQALLDLSSFRGFSDRVSFDEYNRYLISKLPVIMGLSGATGTAVGYYVGGQVLMTSASYLFAGTLLSYTYYSGTYLLEKGRQKDDYINHAISGSFVGGWLYTAIKGWRAGLLCSGIGSIAGIVYKISSDELYHSSRSAWLDHRIHVEYSPQRKLQVVRKQQYTPIKDSTNESLIPKEYKKQ